MRLTEQDLRLAFLELPGRLRPWQLLLAVFPRLSARAAARRHFRVLPESQRELNYEFGPVDFSITTADSAVRQTYSSLLRYSEGPTAFLEAGPAGTQAVSRRIPTVVAALLSNVTVCSQSACCAIPAIRQSARSAVEDLNCRTARYAM